MDKYMEENWPNEDRRNEALDDLSRAINETQPDRGTPSDRELAMLQQASFGLTGSMIAEIMGVSPETVKTQLISARRKIGGRNLTHTCCLALRQGLIQ